MSLYDLTGNKVSFTYGRLVQVASGSYYDGFGNPINLTGSGTTLVTGSTYPITSSWSQNTVSASYALTASYALNGGGSGTTLVTGSTYEITSSWANNVVSASYSLTSSYSDNSISASYSLTASYWSGSVISSSYALSASYALTASYADVAATSISSQNSQDIIIYVKNTSGAIIPKGKVVRIVGVDNSGNVATIELADFSNESDSANTLGFTNESFGINAFGYVITEGYLTTVNTNGFTSGDLLYLSSSGTYTNIKPIPPNHGVRLGQVIRSQQNNGSIYVRIDNGAELDELHNVIDNSTTSSYGDLLIKSGSVWINSKNLTGSYILSGSLNVNDGIVANSVTASFYGTSSWAIHSANVDGGYVTASGILTNGDIIPNNPSASLGTSEYPFKSISISSGSLRIANANPLIAAVVLSNNLGNLDVSSGGIRLIQSDSSFIAPTASFSYLSSSFKQVGDRILIGNDVISGSLQVTNGITSSLYGTSSWANNTVNASYALTASYLVPTNNYTVSNLTASNLSVTGTLYASTFSSSTIYITSSEFIVADNIITLNALNPHKRYAGLELHDSGSNNFSSLLWDSQNNYLFVSSSETVGNRQIILGPDNQVNLISNYIPLINGGNTITSSIIYQNNSNIGVGTTSPSAKVDVVGDVQANAFYGKSFNLTTTSGQSAIFDTFTSTGTGEVYEVTIKGNPNAGESSNYQDVIYGKIIVGTGKTGSVATTFINYVQESPDPRLLYSSGGNSLTASVYFNSASVDVTQKGVGQSTSIRVVVGSYAVGYVGNNTTVRVKQIL